MTSLSQELQAIITGFVGGARYGIKIRLPHALVMTVLFRRDLSPLQKIQAVAKLTAAHAKNLAIFVAGYKVGIAILKWLARMHRDHMISTASTRSFSYALGQQLVSLFLHGSAEVDPSLPRELSPPGIPERHHHSMLAGALTASWIWGRCDSLNYQVLLYVASRGLIGLWKRITAGPDPTPVAAIGGGKPKRDQTTVAYRVITGLAWGLALILFEESPHVLHPSMRKSMDEIYRYNIPSIFGATEDAAPPLEMSPAATIDLAKSPRLYNKSTAVDPLAGRG